MKIIFGISFDSNPYVREYGHNTVLWDTAIVGEQGLLELLELHSGCRKEQISNPERVILYQQSITQYLSCKENCFLSESFKTDSLGTARKVLEWRDRLILSGWSYEMKTTSCRLEELRKIEELFLPKGIGFSDKWMKMLKKADISRILPDNSSIEIHHSKKLLAPYLQEMFDKLNKAGFKCEYFPPKPQANANTNLNKVQEAIYKNSRERFAINQNDDSFVLMHFKDRTDALEYMAHKGNTGAVYINANNTAFDSFQQQLSLPNSGSELANSTPEIVQLFRIGLSLYSENFSLENILSWLSIPVHPLKGDFRYKLRKIIIDTGGICNDEWNRTVSEYEKQDDIDVFLPLNQCETPETNKIILFLARLRSFSVQRQAILRKENNDISVIYDQLSKVIELANALEQILTSINKDKLEAGQLESLISSIDSEGTYMLEKPEKGCRFVCSKTDAIIGNIEECIWLDFYNAGSISNYYRFLHHEEIDALALAGARLWGAKEESLLNTEAQITPLMLAKKLTLVFCDKVFGESTTKHPIALRLEKLIENYSKLVNYPKLEKNKEVEVFNNIVPVAELKLELETKLIPREQESATSLGKLINYPLDYVLNYHAGLRKRSTLPILSISLGNAAHEYIALLVKKSNFDITQMWRQFAENFKSDMEDCILRNSAILNQRENELQKKSYMSKIENSIKNLIEIIVDNSLEITSVEGTELIRREVNPIPVRLIEDKETPVINARMDMVLKNKSDSSIIIDFKWTKYANYHRNDVRKNLSIQLAIYEELEKHNNPNGVASKCYFELDGGFLLTDSNSTLIGKHIEKIEVINDSVLMEQIRNSYKYRYSQLNDGVVEWGDEMELKEIAYFNETNPKNLVPFNESNIDKKTKKINNFSDFTSLTKCAK